MLDDQPDQSVVEVERNNNLNNVGPHDSDLTDCEDSGGELDQELDQFVVEVERNNNLDNVGPHDSDLTDCEDLGGELDQELVQPDLNTNNKRSRKRKRQPEKWQKNVKKSLKDTEKSYQTL
ncbi:uncharacterized protein LOC121736043 [Aricia agestis]|uniref:uncharacterized protein LOC121736043 n=1 Tax=Aricia agestis TaxID=91739 RepID=UPI001C2078C3|nr:uncharacterized protein LOC121736043 [Aricia agestis]